MFCDFVDSTILHATCPTKHPTCTSGFSRCPQVSSPELLREVLITKQDEFSGRPDLVRLKPYFNYQESISTCSTSPTWRLSKKAQISSMKM